MPILRSLGPTAKPGSSRCTAKAEIPLAPFSGSVTAMTVYHSETPELVIQALVPLSTQESPSRRGLGAGAAPRAGRPEVGRQAWGPLSTEESPSRRARVFIAAASEPASRSDRP